MEVLCLRKISDMSYITYIIKIRGLFMRRAYVWEIRNFQKRGCRNIFLAYSRKLMSVKLQLICVFLSSRMFLTL